jgi:hypothetical protein
VNEDASGDVGALQKQIQQLKVWVSSMSAAVLIYLRNVMAIRIKPFFYIHAGSTVLSNEAS